MGARRWLWWGVFTAAGIGLLALLVWWAAGTLPPSPSFLLPWAGGVVLWGLLGFALLRLLEGKRFIESATRAAPLILHVFDVRQRRLVYFNRQILLDLGYTPEEVEAMGGDAVSRFLHPQEQARLEELLGRWDTAEDGQIIETDYRLKHRDGSWRWFHGRDVVFRRGPDGRVWQIIGTAQDVTERKQVEEQLRASLREKDALLKEVHHRVKNNLQVVSSLLQLQGARVEDPGAKAAFRESQNRVRSMALLHEYLFRSPERGRIDLAEHVRGLCSHLMLGFGTDPDRVRLTVEVAPIDCSVDQAIPLGLIINELVSNALKHAFPDGRPGRLSVLLREGEGGRAVLTVADDGVGLPADLDVTRTPGLGLQLVVTLVEQLGGRLDVEREGGTAFHITFSPTREGRA
jgi:PAS domain S-box-containing protein